MDLRKVALLLIAVKFQIACTDCKPQSLKQNPFERYVGSRIKNTADYSKVSYYQMSPKNEQKGIYMNPNIYKTFNFPEVDFPSDTSQREISLFNQGYISSTPTPINKQHELTLLENFKKEARQKRKSKNQTNKKLPVPTQLEKNRPSFVVSGVFPEVEYPMNTMDTMTSKYWNTLPYNTDIDEDFNQQNNYMPRNQANTIQINNINGYVNPTNIKQKKRLFTSAKFKENKNEENKYVKFGSKKSNKVMSSIKSIPKSKNNLSNKNTFGSLPDRLIRGKQKRIKIAGFSDKLSHDKKLEINSSKIHPQSSDLLERLDSKTTNNVNKAINNITIRKNFTSDEAINEPSNVDSIDFLQLAKLSSSNLRDLANQVLKQIGPLSNDLGLRADFSIPNYTTFDNMTVYDVLPKNMFDSSLSHTTSLDNLNDKINNYPLQSQNSNLKALYFIVDKVLEQIGSQQNNINIPDYTSGPIANLGTIPTDYIVLENLVSDKTNEKIVMSSNDNILQGPMKTDYNIISDKQLEPAHTSLISNNLTMTNSLPVCPVDIKDKCTIYDLHESDFSNNTYTLMEILNGSTSSKEPYESRHFIKENVNFNQLQDDLDTLNVSKYVLTSVPTLIGNSTENWMTSNTSNSTFTEVLKYESSGMPENETLHITPQYDTSPTAPYNSMLEDGLKYNTSLAKLENGTLSTMTEYETSSDMPENKLEAILKYKTHRFPDDVASKAKTNDRSEELSPNSIISELTYKDPEYYKFSNYSESDISKDNSTNIQLKNLPTNHVSDITDNKTLKITSNDDKLYENYEIIENQLISDSSIKTRYYKTTNASNYRRISHTPVSKKLENLPDNDKLKESLAYYDALSDKNPVTLVNIPDTPKNDNFENLSKYELRPKISDSDEEILGNGTLENMSDYSLEHMSNSDRALTDTANYSSLLGANEIKTLDTQDTSSKIFGNNIDIDIFSVMIDNKKMGKIIMNDDMAVNYDTTSDTQPEMPAIKLDIPDSYTLEHSPKNELLPKISDSDEKMFVSAKLDNMKDYNSSEDMPHRFDTLIYTANDSSLLGTTENRTLDTHDTLSNNYNNDIDILSVTKNDKKIGETIKTDEITAYYDTISDTQPEMPAIIRNNLDSHKIGNPPNYDLRREMSNRDQGILDSSTSKNTPDCNISEDMPYTYNTTSNTLPETLAIIPDISDIYNLKHSPKNELLPKISDIDENNFVSGKLENMKDYNSSEHMPHRFDALIYTANDSSLAGTTENKTTDTDDVLSNNYNNDIDIVYVTKNDKRIGETIKTDKITAYYDTISDTQPEMPAIIRNYIDSLKTGNSPKYELRPEMLDRDEEILDSSTSKNTPACNTSEDMPYKYNTTSDTLPEMLGIIPDTHSYNLGHSQKNELLLKIPDSDEKMFVSGKLENMKDYNSSEDKPYRFDTLIYTANDSSLSGATENKTLDIHDALSNNYNNDIDILSVTKNDKKIDETIKTDEITAFYDTICDTQPEMPAIIRNNLESHKLGNRPNYDLRPEMSDGNKEILDISTSKNTDEIPDINIPDCNISEDMPYKYNTTSDIPPIMLAIIPDNPDSYNLENSPKKKLLPNISDSDEKLIMSGNLKNMNINERYTSDIDERYSSNDMTHKYNTFIDTANDISLPGSKINKILDTCDALPTNDIDILKNNDNEMTIIKNNDDKISASYDTLSDTQPEIPAIIQSIPDSSNMEFPQNYELWPEITDSDEEKVMLGHDMHDIMFDKGMLKNKSNYGALTEGLNNDALKCTSLFSDLKKSKNITEYNTLTDNTYNSSLSDSNINKNREETLPYTNANDIDNLSAVTDNKEIDEIIMIENEQLNNFQDIQAESAPNMSFTNTYLVSNISKAGLDDNSSNASLDYPNVEKVTDFVEVPEFTSKKIDTAIETDYSDELFDIAPNNTDSNTTPDVLDTVRLNVTDIDQLLDVLLELLIGDSQTNTISGTENGVSTIIDTSLPHITDGSNN